MTWLTAVVRSIEGLNERIGRAVSWLAVLLVLNTCLVAVLRYGFSRGWVWLQESYVWMHAIIFLVAAGYTLLHEERIKNHLDKTDTIHFDSALPGFGYWLSNGKGLGARPRRPRAR
jgi:TRAP-type mannitol/chloroaromatic compound transport system permease small subunit